MSSIPNLFPWIAIAPIHGLFVTDNLFNEAIQESRNPLVQFTKNLGISYLTEAEEKRLFSIEIIRRIGGMRWSDRHYAIKVNYQAPQSGEDLDFIQNETNDLIELVLQMMRVFRSGNIYLGGIAHCIENPYTGITNIFNKSWLQTVPFPYPLTEDSSLLELKDFWLATQSPKIKVFENINVAMRWFNRGCEENRIDDKIINLMIAAEALTKIPKEKKEKATVIAENIAKLTLDKNIDEIKVKEIIFAAYKLRNDFIHEGKISTNWQRKYGHISSQHEFVFEVEKFLRLALRNLILNITGTKLTIPI